MSGNLNIISVLQVNLHFAMVFVFTSQNIPNVSTFVTLTARLRCQNQCKNKTMKNTALSIFRLVSMAPFI